MSQWKNPGTPSAMDIMHSQKSGLARMLEIARRLDALNPFVAEVLGPDLAAHIKVCNVRDHSLVLSTPVATIATRARLEAPRILDKLKTAGVDGIREIEVKVMPHSGLDDRYS